MSLIKRKIDVTITLGTGSFGEDPAGSANTVTLTGLKVAASISKGSLPTLDRANIRVWGMSLSLLNQLTRLGKPLAAIRDNTIRLSAGDDVSGMSQVFTGTIYSAYADFENMPNVALTVSALNGLVDLTKPVAPASFPQGGDVATICAQIAAAMGKPFVNHGVTVRLGPSYFPGTSIDQLRKVCRDANIFALTNGGPNGDAVEIWPKGSARGGLIPVISPETGLVKYPRFSDQGVAVTTLYNPGLSFNGQFELRSSVTPANKVWTIYDLTYELESETPGGKWFCNIGGRLEAL